MKKVYLAALLLAGIVYQSTGGEPEEDYMTQQMPSPLIWEKLHEPVFHGRKDYEAHVNISLMCNTITVLYEVKAISGQRFNELRPLCNESREEDFINMLDETCQHFEAGDWTVTNQTITSQTVTNETVVSSAVLLRMDGAELVIDDQEDVVKQLNKINQAKSKFHHHHLNCDTILHIFHNHVLHQSISKMFLEYLKINVPLEPIETASLKSCRLDRTSKVKKLQINFHINKIDPALQLYEAVSFDQLVPGPDKCLIVYAGPKQIVYNSTDKTYCPVPETKDLVTSSHRAVYNDNCSPKSISHTFQDLKLQCGGPVDPRKLIKIRKTDTSLVIYCSGFFYSRGSIKLSLRTPCPDRVFGLALGPDVSVYDLSSSGFQLVYPVSLFSLTNDTLYDEVQHKIRTQLNSQLRKQLDDQWNDEASHQTQKESNLIWIMILVIILLIVTLLIILFVLSFPKLSDFNQNSGDPGRNSLYKALSSFFSASRQSKIMIMLTLGPV